MWLKLIVVIGAISFHYSDANILTNLLKRARRNYDTMIPYGGPSTDEGLATGYWNARIELGVFVNSDAVGGLPDNDVASFKRSDSPMHPSGGSGSGSGSGAGMFTESAKRDVIQKPENPIKAMVKKERKDRVELQKKSELTASPSNGSITKDAAVAKDTAAKDTATVKDTASKDTATKDTKTASAKPVTPVDDDTTTTPVKFKNFQIQQPKNLNETSDDDVVMQGEEEKSKAKDSITCQGEKEWLQCPTYHLIKVNSAFWGRDHEKPCTRKNVQHGLKTDKMCAQDESNTMAKVQNACDGENACELVASQLYFDRTDCPDVYKYLRLNWECAKSETRIKESLDREQNAALKKRDEIPAKKDDDNDGTKDASPASKRDSEDSPLSKDLFADDVPDSHRPGETHSKRRSLEE